MNLREYATRLRPTLIEDLIRLLMRHLLVELVEFPRNIRRRLRLTAGLLALWLGAPGAVLADGVLADCVRSYSEGSHANEFQFFPATTVSIGRDAVAGDVIGPWITASAPTAWLCTALVSVPYQVMVQGRTLNTRISTSVAHDGQIYAAYATKDPEIGYITRWRYMLDGMVSEWVPLTAVELAQQTPPHSFARHLEIGETYYLGVETQIKLVKRVQHITSGFNNKVFDPIHLRHAHYSPTGGSWSGASTYRASQVLANHITFLAGGTCTTPDVNVDLGKVPIGRFSGIGSTAALKAFELSFQNCPSGLDAIGFRFGATTSVVNASDGVVAADSSSTTSGLGVGFLDEFYDPLEFGRRYPLSAYDSESGGNYTVPLTTALYQIDPVVRGGIIKGAITFTLDYK